VDGLEVHFKNNPLGWAEFSLFTSVINLGARENETLNQALNKLRKAGVIRVYLRDEEPLRARANGLSKTIQGGPPGVYLGQVVLAPHELSSGTTFTAGGVKVSEPGVFSTTAWHELGHHLGAVMSGAPLEALPKPEIQNSKAMDLYFEAAGVFGVPVSATSKAAWRSGTVRHSAE
jgi:hypothetical protein